MNTSKLFSPWYWLLLKIAVIVILASLIYFEIGTGLIVFDKPEPTNVTNEYCKGCGLFGPVIYMSVAGASFLGKLSPILHTMISIVFIINSVLLLIWIFIVRASLKHQKGAAVTISVLSVISLLFILPQAIDQKQYLMILPSAVMFLIALKCSLSKPNSNVDG